MRRPPSVSASCMNYAEFIYLRIAAVWGCKVYLEAALGSMLLYKQERPQYADEKVHRMTHLALEDFAVSSKHKL